MIEFQAEESQGSPSKISLQGIPGCSSPYSTWSALYCSSDPTTPVTWLYGGPADGMSGLRQTSKDADQIGPAYFGFGNGTQVPFLSTETNSTGEHWVNLGLSYDYPDADRVFFPAVTNIMQLFLSAVRLDYGLVLPNNPYLSTQLMNETLQNPFPARSPRSEDWSDILGGFTAEDPVNYYGFTEFEALNATYLDAEYVCRFRHPLPWGPCG